MEWEQQSLDGQSGKTFLEHIQATGAKISESFSKSSRELRTMGLQYLDLLRTSGLGTDASWETVGALPGELSTLNTGESPNVAAASTLSQILQADAPQKYYLSAKACEGILRRAEKRGKALPLMLKKALEAQSGMNQGRDTGCPDSDVSEPRGRTDPADPDTSSEPEDGWEMLL